MKQSRFNVLVVPKEAPGQAILYNTFHDHRLILENRNRAVEDYFNKIDRHESLSAEEQKLSEMFAELGVLVDDDVDEKKLFDNWYDSKIQNPEGMLNLVVVTTMACNLRCSYCYEKNQLDNSKNMTRETAEQFVEWTKKQIRARPIETLDIVYFGGEPLMNKNIVFYMSEELKKFCLSFGIEYNGKMVSNGVLMTPEVSKELRRVGIHKVKVTLDGDKSSHDTSRVSSSGRGSFDAIWYNLQHANDDLIENERPMRFMIGGNFLERTYQGFMPLLDQLANANFKDFIDEINLKPVQEFTSDFMEELSSNPCDLICYSEKNTGRMIELRKELAARGLPAIDNLNFGPCDFYRGDAYTVGMHGGLHPCIAFADNESCSIGTVWEDKPTPKHAEKQEEWKQTKPWTADCYDCKFLPVCVGGCRATAYSNGFAWSSTVCEKNYFDRMSQALAREMLGITATTEEPALVTEPQSVPNTSFLTTQAKELLEETTTPANST